MFNIGTSVEYLKQFIFLIISISELIQQPENVSTYQRLRPGCEFTTKTDWKKHEVLILNKEMNSIIYPQMNKSLFLKQNEEIVLACPKSELLFHNESTFVMNRTATCERGKIIKTEDQNYDFSTVSCKTMPLASSRIAGICYNTTNVLKIEIGFEIESNFISIMTICFDNETLSVIYSEFKLTPKIKAMQTGVPRPFKWFDVDYFNILPQKIYNLYKRSTQNETISKILGSAKLAAKYINKKTNYFFSRGHLSAKADFIYAAEQYATCSYINVAPQWQIINEGNWLKLEINVRTYVMNNNAEISVYTIPYGVAELLDINGRLQKLFLYYNESDSSNNKVTIPKFFIKILHNEIDETGSAFITVNNPHLKNITTDYYLCDNRSCDNYKWLTWQPHNYSLGFSYCCDYNELRNNTIKNHLPDLKITNRL